MTWTRGRRELVLSGRLPLEQGAAFEQAIWNIAKPQRALDKHAGTTLEWQQSDRRRTRHPRPLRRHRQRPQAQPHHPDRAPQRRRTPAPRRRRPAQPRDRRTTRMRRTPPHHQTARPRPPPLPRRTLRLLRPTTRTPQTLTRPLPIPRLHRHRANSKPTTSPPPNTAAKPNSTTSSCSAPATTNASTTTTSTPTAPATTPHSKTEPAAPSPPTNHTHHPAEAARGRLLQEAGRQWSGVDQRVVVAPQAIPRPARSVARPRAPALSRS